MASWSDHMYPVMEQFFTVQGEGAHTGKSAWFIRLGGCDVGCAWCDVKESWDVEAHPKFSCEDLVEKAKNSGAPICVVTGGEPAMHNLVPLTKACTRQASRHTLRPPGHTKFQATGTGLRYRRNDSKRPVTTLISMRMN